MAEVHHWRHGWIPLDVATALEHGKKKDAERLRAEAAKRDPAVRRLSDDELDQGMAEALAREDYAQFDKLSAESDRREAAAPARDLARARREKEANAKLDRMGALIEGGMSEADAHVEVYGGTREDYHRRQAVDALRSQGYQGRSFDELSRQSYRDHVDTLYSQAEEDTRGVLLSREAEGHNARQSAKRGKLIDPHELFTTNEATARKWASKELRSWWDANGRPTLTEWRASLLDDPQQARNLRARRSYMAASAHVDNPEGDPMQILAPPAEWFADPVLPGPTALTVDEAGRVYGHIAAWGTEHLGQEGTEAPRSPSNYRYFRTGAVLTADGEQVPVGRLTVGTGHAAMDAGVTAAAEHYDHTGAAAADVAVGEDEFGIWCAGVVRPGATPEQVHALRASPLSGDWRSIDGQLELVGALAVNVPGFPVPRLVADAGVPRALVAAGAVATTEEGEVKVTFTDDQLAALRRKLGVNDDATGEAILAAVDEKAALVAAAEAKATEVEAEKAALVASAKLPDGTEIVESASLAELRAAAELGRAAHARQANDDRAALVASAVKDGRVAPARREHWLKQLEADPGAEAVLASLAPGLIPVAEIGHAGEHGDPEADALYASIFGKDGA